MLWWPGYDQVFFVDCDAEILPGAPPIESAMGDGGAHIHLVRGHSGRFNSGVVMVRNGAPSRAFFREVWNGMGAPLSEADNVGWGENGHVIQLSKEADCIAELSRSWNNTRLPPPHPEYIRHHTGPIRAEEARLRAVAEGRDASELKPQMSPRLTTRPSNAPALRLAAHKLAAEYAPTVPPPPPPGESRTVPEWGRYQE